MKNLFNQFNNSPEFINFREAHKQQIDKKGWSHLWYPAKKEKPPIAYTIGLKNSYKHPDLCVLGLENKKSVERLKKAVDLIKSETVFEKNQDYVWIEKNPVQFELLREEFNMFVFLSVAVYYQSLNFSVLQMVWQDEFGRFPKDESCSPQFKENQNIRALL